MTLSNCLVGARSGTAEKKRPTVEAYTDGGCSPNPGFGGAGAVLRWVNSSGTLTERELIHGERETTNNRMEITAVLLALEALRCPCEVTVYSDSQYVVQSINGWLAGWAQNGFARGSKQKPQVLVSADLWRRMHALMQVHDVKAVWVRGHSGNVLNDRADALATKGLKSARVGAPKSRRRWPRKGAVANLGSKRVST